MARRRLIDRIIGGSERERERRRRLAAQFASWIFVGIVVLLVGLLGAQFFTRTVLTHPVSGELDRPDMLVRKGERIQVNVLNGSNRSRVALRFTDYLRARKFDVVHIDNYKDTGVARSFLVDRVGDSISAKKLAYALGIEDSLIRRDIDTEEYVKADVIIGKDFPQLKPMK
ncbi:MAG: LytR C-terminal domain-containing protein [Bacteroidota bacterium]|nr:LytR C-terminal domain-containing protein [Bacteroidota bacterium]MDP4234458.1 LytR C-terminal domain-containing protein [Bacteroidota bacterium]MDP4243960.1 LytR C-terminal domain-containing protein [Bacteroidota bacterium]MDP4288190.1 LytR C-terminal domain-containing protein [Bacteroidota bacterium]